ncbi:unnamed protein product [Cuscuta epithymum]|uniref:Uncharacterized protein n=1 Tax=Cuscuta epithymum TaxID=186058 RepID=A0AAV0GHT1_9ASTE|nr:unnamed protein product [Cuscuta epithymum]
MKTQDNIEPERSGYEQDNDAQVKIHLDGQDASDHEHKTPNESEKNSSAKRAYSENESKTAPALMDARKEETTADAPVPIPKAIPHMPFPPPPECIKLIEDLSLSLVPRIKFNYTLGCMGSFVRPVDVFNVKIIISHGLEKCYVFPSPITIPFDDIRIHIVSPFKWTVTDEGKERWILADGHFFFRDQRLVS